MFIATESTNVRAPEEPYVAAIYIALLWSATVQFGYCYKHLAALRPEHLELLILQRSRHSKPCGSRV
jgi:hypothetical protein